VPSQVANDTNFPFEMGDPIIVRIEENKLVIRRARPEEHP
jgi:hypothetical protein